ncbi:MAG: hypothetical protein GXC76_10570 [Rhodanobacteraceae bacterium]|jgi:hypothetical protein|nr:hypothetical protein [Rhodanobacteraceae bacterium]
MKCNRTAAVVSFALALNACSDPKAANKGNFEQALESYFEQTRGPACIRIGTSNPPFPATLADQGAWGGEQIRAIADAGLANATAATTKSTSYTSDGPVGDVPAKRYELNDLGKKFYQERTINGAMGKVSLHELCFGIPRLVAIDSFTEPADMMGYRISKVTYRYRIDEVPQWVSTEAIRKTFPQIAARTDKEQSETTTFVLTSSGWAHESVALH